jgi:gliding motility associated protien GldN
MVTAQEEEQEKKWERMKPMATLFPRTIVKEKEPIEYMPTNEDNITRSKIVWRIIDCREKMNFPLYYPTILLDSRKSLVQTLYEGIQSGAVQAYDDEEFITLLTPTEVLGRFDASDRMVTREKIDGNGDTTYLIKGEIHWEEVREFIVKERWYFDRHYSQLFVRIIGICPTRVYNKELNLSSDDDYAVTGQELKRKLFWVYFPEARRVLGNSLTYIENNDMAQISFDDLLHKRRFQSYIIAESNPLNDRKITDYTRDGIRAIMESERIKREIMNWESDLWEY